MKEARRGQDLLEDTGRGSEIRSEVESLLSNFANFATCECLPFADTLAKRAKRMKAEEGWPAGPALGSEKAKRMKAEEGWPAGPALGSLLRTLPSKKGAKKRSE